MTDNTECGRDRRQIRPRCGGQRLTQRDDVTVT
jgi:hypothetical protein